MEPLLLRCLGNYEVLASDCRGCVLKKMLRGTTFDREDFPEAVG
jgi:hypothetical protein